MEGFFNFEKKLLVQKEINMSGVCFSIQKV